MNKAAFYGTACINLETTIGKSSYSGLLNLLVLESDTHPNYYSRANFPPNKHKDNWRLFLLLKRPINCFQDLVLRKSYQIMDKLDSKVEIMPGQITFEKKETQCIRINTSEISSLETIIKELESIGIEFVKDKKVKEFTTKVFFKRYTEFVKIQDGVYRDSVLEGRYFFEINKLIDWETFNVGVEKIKNNCNFHLFDSFLAFNISNGKASDFFGIYSEHCDQNRFGELRDNINKVFSL